MSEFKELLEKQHSLNEKLKELIKIDTDIKYFEKSDNEKLDDFVSITNKTLVEYAKLYVKLNNKKYEITVPPPLWYRNIISKKNVFSLEEEILDVKNKLNEVSDQITMIKTKEALNEFLKNEANKKIIDKFYSLCTNINLKENQIYDKLAQLIGQKDSKLRIYGVVDC